VTRKLVPRGAKEGDYLQLEIEDGNIIQAHLDPEATQAARKRRINWIGFNAVNISTVMIRYCMAFLVQHPNVFPTSWPVPEFKTLSATAKRGHDVIASFA